MRVQQLAGPLLAVGLHYGLDKETAQTLVQNLIRGGRGETPGGPHHGGCGVALSGILSECNGVLSGEHPRTGADDSEIEDKTAPGYSRGGFVR